MSWLPFVRAREDDMAKKTDKPNILIIWGDDIGWFNVSAKVGLPGADLGLQPEDSTIADVLKPLGYVTGQFGKNHLLVPAQAIVAGFLQTFKEFPPRQKPASFSIDQALEKARQQEKGMAAKAGHA